MSIISKNKEAVPFIFTDSIYRFKEKISYSVFDFEGENNRNILIVLFKPIENKEKEFLEKILTALNLKIHDTAILSIDKYPMLGISDVKKYFAPKKILFFGTQPKNIGINAIIPNYNIGELESIMILGADSLNIISNNEDLKKKLWIQLKAMFNV